MARFVIDTGDIDLSGTQEAALNNELQRTALGFLADLRFDGVVGLRLPDPSWYGLLIARNPDIIPKMERELGGLVSRGRG